MDRILLRLSWAVLRQELFWLRVGSKIFQFLIGLIT